LATYVTTNALPPIRIGDKSMPELAGLQPRPSAELEFPKSELRVAGALARRKLVAAPELPSWPYTEVLTNSVVQLFVDGDGTPISAALVSGSGLKAADNYALAAAKRLRFRPSRTGEAVTSGTANFLWQTLPPGVTNIASPGLSPP
jgi:TonB family protein